MQWLLISKRNMADGQHQDQTSCRETVLSESVKDHLTLLQEPISRLSTSAAVFKGFTATIVTGIAALSYKDIELKLLILAFVPIIVFAILDIYYLQLEKRYRGLYNDVLSGKHKPDYSITLPSDKESIKRAKATILNCLCSPSILLFYPAMIAVLIAVCVMKSTRNSTCRRTSLPY